MKEKSYWEQFMQSGKVEDYLKFKNETYNNASIENATFYNSAFENAAFSNSVSGNAAFRDAALLNVTKDEHNPKGDVLSAGINNRNRDDYQGSAYRGIR